MYRITVKIIVTIPRYKIDILPESNNEVLLKKTELSMKESDSVKKKLKLT